MQRVAGSPPKAFAAFRKAELDRRWADATEAVEEYLGRTEYPEPSDLIALVRYRVEGRS